MSPAADKSSARVFQELHCEGLIPNRARQVKLPVKMSQLFEMGRNTQYPASSMGKTRIHCELNLNRFALNDGSSRAFPSPAVGRRVLNDVTASGSTVVGRPSWML